MVDAGLTSGTKRRPDSFIPLDQSGKTVHASAYACRHVHRVERPGPGGPATSLDAPRHLMIATAYTLIPLAAMVAGAAVAAFRAPGPAVESGIQHFAAGVVFAAAAGEILPDLKQSGSTLAIVGGGLAGLAAMLAIRWLGRRVTSGVGSVAVTGIDLLVDGLVLGIGFAVGARQGLLLTIALTLEVLFLGLTMALALRPRIASGALTTGVVGGVGLLLPLGAWIGSMASGLPPVGLAGLLAFGLIALLYLVTEELLVEAHEKPDSPITTSMFFIGFLLLIAIEELV